MHQHASMSITGLIWAAVALAFLCSAGFTWLLFRTTLGNALLDHPNERSLHAQPVPRSGGIAIVTAIVLASLLAIQDTGMVPPLGIIAIGAAIIAVISFFDDLSHIPVALRLLVQVAVAAFLVKSGLTVPGVDLPGVRLADSGWISGGFCVLLTVWLVNLYNFMDGMDGFAAGMSLIGFATLGYFGAAAGAGVFTAFCLVIAAASAGFLIFNFPPARIFMGDVGASLLGFLVAAMAVWADRDGIASLWVVLIVFSPFIVDATVTLARRASRRERIWQAHRTHYYQRLVRLGWGHRKTVLGEYALMFGCSGLALWSASQSVPLQWLALCIWVLAYAMLMAFVTRQEQMSRGTDES